MKKWLLAALALLVVGGLIFVAAMASKAFDFRVLSNRGDAGIETETHEVREDFDSLDLRLTTEKLTLLPSKDGKCTVETRVGGDRKINVAVSGGTLAVESVRDQGVSLFSFGSIETAVTVFLPKNSYASLAVETDTGDVEIPADFDFGSILVSGDTADVDLRASASGSVEVKTTTGDVLLEGLRAERLTVQSSTGKQSLRDVTVSGGLTLKSSTGKQSLTGVTASGAVELKSSTGDKEIDALRCPGFRSESDTGDVRCRDLVASGELGLLEDDDRESWKGILLMRNLVVHNNAVSDRSEILQLGELRISMRPDRMMKGPPSTYVVMSSMASMMFYRWLVAVNGRQRWSRGTSGTGSTARTRGHGEEPPRSPFPVRGKRWTSAAATGRRYRP